MTRPSSCFSFHPPTAFGALLLLLTACASSPGETSGDDARSRDDARLVALLDEIFERRVAESPQRESSLGRKTERQGLWDDRTDAFAQAQVERVKADLERLRSEFDADALSADGRLSYELFEFDSERRIANHGFRDHHYVVDQFNGQLSGLLTVLQNHHRIDTAQDAADYVARIRGLEGVLGVMTEQLRQRAEAGVVAPAFSFPDVIADATAMASGAPIEPSGAPNPLWADFSEKIDALDVSSDARDQLLADAREVLAGPYRRGFDGLLAELRRLQGVADGNRGVWALPRGEAFYANRVAQHTTLDLDARAIHEIGLQEVARIQGEMRAIQEQVGFEGSLQDFFDFIRTDPGNSYEDSDAGRAVFLDEAQARVDAIYEVVGDWFNRLPRATMEVRRVEPWRENSESIAFYSRPSQDGSRPGIYYANLGDMPSVQRYVFSAITYHESVPGHHFQIALAQELEGLPMFRRFGGYGAFVEGWALYAEQLAGEMGFYESPLHDFGRLQNELWRAARLVLDTGIHAERWTREQSIDYFRENTPLSDGNIVTEVERFFVNPGQALSYKMGMLEILRLRAAARETLGERFDIRAFHDAVIGAGALPLPLLERRVEAYVEAAS